MKEEYKELKEDVLDEEKAIEKTLERLSKVRNKFELLSFLGWLFEVAICDIKILQDFYKKKYWGITIHYLEEKKYSIVSRMISDAIREGLIKDYDPSNKSRKYAEYIPYWA